MKFYLGNFFQKLSCLLVFENLRLTGFLYWLRFYLDNFFQKLSFLLVFESLRLTGLNISFLL